MDAVMQRLLSDASLSLGDAAQRSSRSLLALIARERQALEVLARNRVLSNPSGIIDARRESLMLSEERLVGALPRLVDAEFSAVSALDDRLSLAASRIVRPHRSASEALASQLAALSPYGVLSRGYAIVRDAEGHVVSKAESLEAGEKIDILLASGCVEAAVEQIHADPRS